MAQNASGSKKPSTNRGPAAAEDNRGAILQAARTVFAERGYHVAYSAIAKEAGVGQGVLYRHFPDRITLAFAVFEEHFQQYEHIAADPSPESFARLWQALVTHVIQETAFIDMVVDARRSIPDYDGFQRMERILDGPLRRAKEAGLIATDVTAEEVGLSIRMAYGIVCTATESQDDLYALVGKALPRLPLP